jgi:DNA mismatch endonuclease (patch repair protein)
MRRRGGVTVVDILTPEKRSWNMSRIRGRDTTPEKTVRSLLRRMGYRVEVYPRSLPGKPDIVLSRRRIAVFVHGCFWHRHRGCRYAYRPKSNRAFWKRKFEANVKRDREVGRALRKLGWRILIVWECQIEKPDKLTRKLQYLLGTNTESRRAR